MSKKKKPGPILPPTDRDEFDYVSSREAGMTALTAVVLVGVIIGFTYWVVN